MKYGRDFEAETDAYMVRTGSDYGDAYEAVGCNDPDAEEPNMADAMRYYEELADEEPPMLPFMVTTVERQRLAGTAAIVGDLLLAELPLYAGHQDSLSCKIYGQQGII